MKYGFQHFFFNLKTAIESSIFNVGLRKLFHHIEYYYNTSWVFHLIWYYTTWTSTIYFHITIFVWNTYPEPVLDIWNYNMAYNLSGHSEPCDPHNFSTLYITFLDTLDQGDPSSYETWDLGIVPTTSGYSEPALTTNCEPITTTIYKLNQYLLQPTYDMLTNYIWNSAYNYN